jgi:hypothetical protein
MPKAKDLWLQFAKKNMVILIASRGKKKKISNAEVLEENASSGILFKLKKGLTPKQMEKPPFIFEL